MSTRLYRVAQKSKPQTFVHTVTLQILDNFQNFFTGTSCGKFVMVMNWLVNIGYHNTLTVSLHYLVKYKFSKITIITINAYAKTYPIKLLFTNFLTWIKQCLVLDTLLMFVNIRRRYCVQDGPKNKLQNSCYLFTEYWWILQIYTVSQKTGPLLFLPRDAL